MRNLEHFSKASKEQKIEIIDHFTNGKTSPYLKQTQLSQSETQSLLDEISENVIGNFVLPFSIAPNFLINESIYHIPMVIEESSVIAAASSAAKFWSLHGGFRTKIISKIKTGQVHFTWNGNFKNISPHWVELKKNLLSLLTPITEKMQARGGGIKNILWKDSSELEHYHQLHVEFDTVDAMGANFINTCLEALGTHLSEFLDKTFNNISTPTIIMCILSNHVPECLVTCEVSCSINALAEISRGLDTELFARKFEMAVNIANSDIHRAVTHNKGIFNGIDAVALATGNDFRAIEAGGHAYASISGKYKSLSFIHLDNKEFRYVLQVPLAVGTVGGLTVVHPITKLSLEILQHPSAEELMQIMAAAGMANNFSAIRALITSGIQQGHMKLHLPNILMQLNASEEERTQALKSFEDKTVSYSAVLQFLEKLRNSTYES